MMEITDLKLTLSESEDSKAAREIHEHLRAHVEAAVGPANRHVFVASLTSPKGEVVAGLRGFSHWKWFYISHLWVSDTLRGLGAGAQLLAAAESEARARTCVGLYVDTFSPDALRFYVREGFEEVGKIPEFPPGSTRYFLSKLLA